METHFDQFIVFNLAKNSCKMLHHKNRGLQLVQFILRAILVILIMLDMYLNASKYSLLDAFIMANRSIYLFK
ncbi:hypothetical protein E2143_08610 [Oenococcus oeni]|nr:hypothetical protein ATX72_00565 [Oenococcus oeni]QGR00684.1 hypothetical protein E4R25_01725 [Oenococcus oeni]TEU20018.1 hypothetical protein E2146_07255 [Oenococcus oeni]TEU22321.1 hypothetical protein E2147_08540 [Oenococcus oeni]TEU52952.1 hypothetical protein E2145_08365 [Oenococcus oeni]